MALKGHTKIELTNVNTGEVETYEDDNMVTNALEDLFHPLGFFGNQSITSDKLLASNNESTNSDRLLHTTTGGLLLFDKSLEEDPELTIVPAGVSMTGHACYRNYTGTDKTFGSYNNNESGLLYDGYGYKHVWDFQTNQANGKISCACLTTALGGFMGTGSYPECNDYTDTGSHERNFPCYRHMKVEGSDSNMPVYFNGTTEILLLLKNSNSFSYFPPNNIYQVHVNNISNSFLKTGNLTFMKRRVPFNSLSIFDFSMKGQYTPILENNIIVHLDGIEDAIPEEALKLATNQSNRYCFNYKIYEDNGYLFFVLSYAKNIEKTGYSDINIATAPRDILCHVWKIDANTLEVKKYYKIVNTTELPVWVRYSSHYEASHGTNYYHSHFTPLGSRGTDTGANPFVIAGENLVCCCGNANSFYFASIDLNNQSQVSLIVPEGEQNSENAVYAMNVSEPRFFSFHMAHKNKIYFCDSHMIYYNSKKLKIKVMDLNKYTIGYVNSNFEDLGLYITSGYTTDTFRAGLLGKIGGIKENIFVQCVNLKNATGYWMRMFYMPNMLITINNLPQTITKTNEQTMKVTYTLVDDSYEVD